MSQSYIKLPARSSGNAQNPSRPISFPLRVPQRKSAVYGGAFVNRRLSTAVYCQPDDSLTETGLRQPLSPPYSPSISAISKP